MKTKEKKIKPGMNFGTWFGHRCTSCLEKKEIIFIHALSTRILISLCADCFSNENPNVDF